MTVTLEPMMQVAQRADRLVQELQQRSSDSMSAATGEFRSDLSAAQQREDGAATQTEAEVREAATQLISSALLLPLMELLHETSTPAEPFAPGIAERRFRPLLDQHLMDQVVNASNFSLVDRIVEQLTPRSQAGAGIDVEG